MANQLITIEMVTEESLMVLENELGFAAHCTREWDDQFGVKGAKIGNTINIRKPPRYVVSVGQALDIQDATETTVPLVLTSQWHVDMAFTSADFTLSIDNFQKRFIKPAMAALANKVDFDGTLQYQNIYNTVGTPGTVPNDADTYLAAGQRLSDEAAPLDSRNLCMTPKMNRFAVGFLKGLFNPQAKIGQIFSKGMVAMDTLGFKGWYLDQNLRTHVVGPQGGSPQVNGSNQTGTSLLTQGWTAAAASRLKRGDVFTITGVNAVNPQNRQSTGDLRQFVVQADFSSAADGTGTIQILPAITPSGPFQTVDSTPIAGNAINVLGAANTSTPQGLVFAEECFALGTADLRLPTKGVESATRATDDEIGISIRIIEAYDINQDRFPSRADILGGFTTLYPEMGVRIAS